MRAVSREFTPLPHYQLPSDCAAPGEGWAAGPSRRDAQRPSGGRRSRRGSRGCGGGCCHQGSVRGDCCCGPSPHTVRRWSAKRPETANTARQGPTINALVKCRFRSQPTAPNHPSVDFARRGLGVRFPSSPPTSPQHTRPPGISGQGLPVGRRPAVGDRLPHGCRPGVAQGAGQAASPGERAVRIAERRRQGGNQDAPLTEAQSSGLRGGPSRPKRESCASGRCARTCDTFMT
jgi:hypothetical protein